MSLSFLFLFARDNACVALRVVAALLHVDCRELRSGEEPARARISRRFRFSRARRRTPLRVGGKGGGGRIGEELACERGAIVPRNPRARCLTFARRQARRATPRIRVYGEHRARCTSADVHARSEGAPRPRSRAHPRRALRTRHWPDGPTPFPPPSTSEPAGILDSPPTGFRATPRDARGPRTPRGIRSINSDTSISMLLTSIASASMSCFRHSGGH